MSIKRVTTIVPTDLLSELEKCLRAVNVPGMTIDDVRGFGEHANYFSRDLLISNARVEIYIGEARCQEIVQAITDFALRAHAIAGILTIENVETMVNLNTGEEILAQDL